MPQLRCGSQSASTDAVARRPNCLAAEWPCGQLPMGSGGRAGEWPRMPRGLEQDGARRSRGWSRKIGNATARRMHLASGVLELEVAVGARRAARVLALPLRGGVDAAGSREFQRSRSFSGAFVACFSHNCHFQNLRARNTQTSMLLQTGPPVGTKYMAHYAFAPRGAKPTRGAELRGASYGCLVEPALRRRALRSSRGNGRRRGPNWSQCAQNP